MGAWGSGSFENDDALDWFAELEAEGLRAAGHALSAVEQLAPEYLEASTCSAGLAAAEVVAALRGRPASDLPDDVRAWLAGVSDDPEALLPTARRAVELIAADSELKDLWVESADYRAWQSAVEDLQARLA